MKILVIVVTYNGLRWLDRCLGSVRASEVPADLYVWDNDSADGSADFVAARFPEAKLTRSADNLGFAEANNMGMRYALDNYEFPKFDNPVPRGFERPKYPRVCHARIWEELTDC